jgi:hypothetical protein
VISNRNSEFLLDPLKSKAFDLAVMRDPGDRTKPSLFPHRVL